MKIEIELDKVKELLTYLKEATNEKCWNCEHLHGNFMGIYNCDKEPNSCQSQRWRTILEELKMLSYK